MVTNRRIEMDCDGDLTLVVGPEGNEVEFLVCSRTLSRASPVFKAMLYGKFHWKESHPKTPSQSPWVVSLPDDCPGTTRIFLSIIHACFDQVPTACESVEELYPILVMADKYEMTKLLRPWVQGWLSSSPNLLGDHACYRSFWPVLGVAVQLGCEELVREIFQRIIKESKCDEQGNLEAYPHDLSGDLLILETAGLALTPFELIDLARETRAALISHILEKCVQPFMARIREAVDLGEDHFGCHAPHKDWEIKVTPDVTKCQSSSLGMLSAALSSTHMCPSLWLTERKVDEPQTRGTSVEDIVSALEWRRSNLLEVGSRKHKRCNGVALLLQDIRNCIVAFTEQTHGPPLPQKTLDFMEKQRAIFGPLSFSDAPTPCSEFDAWKTI
ncbi:hypothetical protein QBC39DRAFT_302761 [Podospora conica]|nr:hypothetical protein QBC39DRAFT_302761 [Schizothecium conicum]